MERDERGFERAAAYESWYSTPRGRRLGRVELRLLRSALRGCVSVLDVGCGTGFFVRKVDAFCVGLDISEEMLGFARRLGGVYVRGNAERLPFSDKSFHCVFCVALLEFVADPKTVLSEMVRVGRKRVVVGLLGRWGFLNIVRRLRDAFSGGWFKRARFLSPRVVEAFLGRRLRWRSSFDSFGLRGFLGEFVMGVLEIEG